MSIFPISGQAERSNSHLANEGNPLSGQAHTSDSIFSSYLVKDDESLTLFHKQEELPQLTTEDYEMFSEFEEAYAPAKKQAKTPTKKQTSKKVSKKVSSKKLVRKPIKKTGKKTVQNNNTGPLQNNRNLKQLSPAKPYEYTVNGKNSASSVIPNSVLSKNAVTLTKTEQEKILKDAGIDISDDKAENEALFKIKSKDNSVHYYKVVNDNGKTKIINTIIKNGKAKVHVYGVNREIKTEQKEKPKIINTEQKANPIINLGINGKIDERVRQGQTGDCWLLSGVMALNATAKGRAIIKNSIRPNNDGSVTVNFMGAKLSYTITPEEIKKHDTDYKLNDAYSNGDNDMLVLELAMEKLRKETGTAKNPKWGYLDGGNAYEVFIAMVPESIINKNKITALVGKNLTNQNIDKLIRKAAGNKNITLCCNIRVKKGTSNMVKKGYNKSPTGLHAYTITGIKGNQVTLVDPHDTHAPITMSLDKLKEVDISAFYSLNLQT